MAKVDRRSGGLAAPLHSCECRWLHAGDLNPPTAVRELHGGRHWWAHLDFTPIDIEPATSRKQVEELMNVQGIGEKSFLKLRAQLTVGAAAPASQQ